MKAKFDPNKPFSTRYGHGKPLYVQNGVVFNKQGQVVDDTEEQPVIPEVPQVEIDTPKPEPKPITPEDKIVQVGAPAKKEDPKPKAKAKAKAKPKAKAEKEKPKAEAEAPTETSEGASNEQDDLLAD